MHQSDRRITHSELRRAYELCYGSDVDPRIQFVARESIKFVKVEKNSSHFLGKKKGKNKSKNNTMKIYHHVKLELSLSEIPAPWEASDWKTLWDERKLTSKPSSEPKPHDWRKQANAFVFAHSPLAKL